MKCMIFTILRIIIFKGQVKKSGNTYIGFTSKLMSITIKVSQIDSPI